MVDPTDAVSLSRDGFAGERFDAVVSCMASRTGVPKDAWAIDHRAHLNVLDAARQAGVGHFVLLSAICVQKPLLAFQHAKLAFEAALTLSGLRYSIVRPTAFFKSLSGQIKRVRRGRPFLLFGDGTLTACKPISDDDLADYIAGCLEQESRWNRILPIGGPGEAITPRQQGEALFALLGRPPKFRSIPVALLDVIAGGLGALARTAPSLAEKAELAGSAAITPLNPCWCWIRRRVNTMRPQRHRREPRPSLSSTAQFLPAPTRPNAEITPSSDTAVNRGGIKPQESLGTRVAATALSISKFPNAERQAGERRATWRTTERYSHR